MRIPEFARIRLLAWARRVMASREPDFIIRSLGPPQTLRWHAIPRNKLFNIYIHKWVGSDDDRALHDHPYHNASILISGEYIEVVREGEKDVGHKRLEGHFYVRRATAGHRVALEMAGWGAPPENEPLYNQVITLFITGPRFRDWGFLCPKGWVHEDVYRDKRDKGMRKRPGVFKAEKERARTRG